MSPPKWPSSCPGRPVQRLCCPFTSLSPNHLDRSLAHSARRILLLPFRPFSSRFSARIEAKSGLERKQVCSKIGQQLTRSASPQRLLRAPETQNEYFAPPAPLFCSPDGWSRENWKRQREWAHRQALVAVGAEKLEEGEDAACPPNPRPPPPPSAHRSTTSTHLPSFLIPPPFASTFGPPRSQFPSQQQSSSSIHIQQQAVRLRHAKGEGPTISQHFRAMAVENKPMPSSSPTPVCYFYYSYLRVHLFGLFSMAIWPSTAHCQLCAMANFALSP
jgi:hypothetical protein